jgi:hypothetical protein
VRVTDRRVLRDATCEPCDASDVRNCESAVRLSGTLLVLTCVALVGTACSATRSTLPSRTHAHSGAASATTHVKALPGSETTEPTTTTSEAPASPTASARLSASSFFVEPCAAIVGSPSLTSNLDLRPFLLTAAQLPAGVVIDGPHHTSTTPGQPMTYASVPTTSPAAYENISLSHTSTAGGGALRGLSEVIGDVGSATFANQLLSVLDADLAGPTCGSDGRPDMVPLPGTIPPVSAAVSGGTQRSGSESGAKLFAAKGSRLICLTWSSSSTYNGFGPPKSVPNLPPLPDASEIAQVLKSALALIPG